MKTTLLPEALRYDGFGPMAGLSGPAVACVDSSRGLGMATRLPTRIVKGIDDVRVAAVQEIIRTGRYVADTDEVAAGVLAAIAPGRRH